MTSHEKVLKALDKSIEKWRKIASGRGVDEGADNCALCQLFEDYCDKCPVMLYSGLSSCHKTPYDTFTHYCQNHGFFLNNNINFFNEVALDDTSAEMALVEMNFLKLVKEYYIERKGKQ